MQSTAAVQRDFSSHEKRLHLAIEISFVSSGLFWRNDEIGNERKSILCHRIIQCKNYAVGESGVELSQFLLKASLKWEHESNVSN